MSFCLCRWQSSLGNKALFPCSSCQISEGKKFVLFNVLVRDNFASTIGVHARSTKEKRRFSLFLCRFKSSNFDETRFTSFLLDQFYKTTSVKIIGKLGTIKNKLRLKYYCKGIFAQRCTH